VPPIRPAAAAPRSQDETGSVRELDHHDGVDRPAELAAYLKLCRSRVAPEDVGLPSTGARRTPGLRREEVAAISGVGMTWYTRLEQGRAPSVSASVIDALARSLLLDDAEHAHLRTLAGLPSLAEEPSPPDEHVQRLLDALDPNPALALDHRWDIVGWNDAHRRVLIDLEAVAPHERNLLRIVFTHPGVRGLMADWEHEAPILVAEYRADVAARGDDPQQQALVTHLRETDGRFRTWWDEHRVATFRPRLRHFQRADGSTQTLEHQRLQLVASPGITFIAYLPAR
jgi:transcriptional regulator with XRE-family HTH domain